MKKIIMLLAVFYSYCAMAGDPAPLPDLDFTKMLKPVPSYSKLESKDWFVWGGAVLEGKDHKYHMIYCRWPKKYPFVIGWVVSSELCYAVSDSPIGPFKHVRTILRGRKFDGKPHAWDGGSVFNPHLKKFGDKVYLYYAACFDPESTEMIGDRNRQISHQTIGVLVADSVIDLANGRFKRLDQPLLKPVKRYGRFVKKGNEYGDFNDPIPSNTMVNNPSVVERADGKYLMMYKSWKPQGGMVHGVALADSPVGPFKFVPAEAFKGYAEDPFIWVDKRRHKIFALVKDFNGNITKKGASLALFESVDGLEWKPSKHVLASDLKIVWEDGRPTKKVANLERPQLLLNKQGDPIVLYAACCITSPYQKGGHSFNIQIPLEVPKVEKK